ncbi:hypothetical protein D0T84_11480 [Dysgonomonas sp. 521]|uniref:hypothetical protein n=1 Tax=Dysgonomonas sp. 521 TaxID=2302932 RepID=UPI0013D8B50B|nr:hypothetical protein [Dysgonomonas sp. 521]NDV95526.1 hypothetical protein [Dysgonomonas sp. 521]
MKRYTKSGRYYANYYLVECPECHKPANVEKGILNCPNCMAQKDANDNILYKAYIKRFCPYCGKDIYAEQSGFKVAPKELSVTCSHCEATIEYSPNVASYRKINSLPQNSGLMKDPFFRLPLWLQGTVRGNLFWAYNREHLQEIKEFVESDLRERKWPYLMTMTAKLPAFIKDAKNRSDVIKEIERLERK